MGKLSRPLASGITRASELLMERLMPRSGPLCVPVFCVTALQEQVKDSLGDGVKGHVETTPVTDVPK